MSIIRYEPWALLGRLQRELDGGRGEAAQAGPRWAPAVDIREESDRYVLHADLPGVDPADIEITHEKGVLSIEGVRKHDHEQEHEGYRREERARGRFLRRFSLPDVADAEAITARSANGVLEVVIPKQQAKLPRKIAVSA